MLNVYILTHDASVTFSGTMPIRHDADGFLWLQMTDAEPAGDATLAPAEESSKAGSKFAFKPKASVSAASSAPLDLFAARKDKPNEEEADAAYAKAAQAAHQALHQSVNLSVTLGTAPNPIAPVVVEEPPAPVWTKKYGPYDEPNLLIVDILRQLSHDGFEAAKFDANKRWAAQSYVKAANQIHGWPRDVLDGKKAAKEIDGVGKGTADKIDRILRDKFVVSDGKTYHPKGDVLPKEVEDAAKAALKEAKEAEKRADKEAAKAEREAKKAADHAKKLANWERENLKREAEGKKPLKLPKALEKKEPGVKVKEEPIVVDDDDESDVKREPAVKREVDVKHSVKSEPASSPKTKPPAAKKAAATSKKFSKAKQPAKKRRRKDSDEDSEEESEANFSEDEAELTPEEDDDESEDEKPKRKLVRKNR